MLLLETPVEVVEPVTIRIPETEEVAILSWMQREVLLGFWIKGSFYEGPRSCTVGFLDRRLR